MKQYSLELEGEIKYHLGIILIAAKICSFF